MTTTRRQFTDSILPYDVEVVVRDGECVELRARARDWDHPVTSTGMRDVPVGRLSRLTAASE